jgi:hypothetical protein
MRKNASCGAGLQKPGFKKKPNPVFFVWVFWVICPAERVFRVFLVSRMLLCASRL